jgi:translation elongation factor EF-1alpha
MCPPDGQAALNHLFALSNLYDLDLFLVRQVIAARKGEFETGFERGGQTREHAQLAKTLGVSKLLVVVNKMDDPSVEWSKERLVPRPFVLLW